MSNPNSVHKAMDVPIKDAQMTCDLSRRPSLHCRARQQSNAKGKDNMLTLLGMRMF